MSTSSVFLGFFIVIWGHFEAKKVYKGNGLFELRAKGKEGIGRAFYCFQVGQRIVILHGFIKKTQTTPDDELALARKRLKEVQQHG